MALVENLTILLLVKQYSFFAISALLFCVVKALKRKYSCNLLHSAYLILVINEESLN